MRTDNFLPAPFWRRLFGVLLVSALLSGLSGAVHAFAGGTSEVLIYAVYYDTYVANEPDEAVALINIGSTAIDLAGWQITDGEGTVTFPSFSLQPGQIIWVTKTATTFTTEFGFAPDLEYGGDSDPTVPDLSGTAPAFANTGDEVILLDDSGQVVDAVVFEGGDTTITGWTGAAISPYTQGYFGVEGQVLYRKLDQSTGLPVPDTDSASDWAQDPADSVNGQKIRYPGWDLEHFFQTYKTTASARLTYAVAPDNVYDAYVAEINQATTSIYIEGYSFTNPAIADALIAKLQQGVQVKILLEEEVVNGIDDQEKWICQQLEANGGECWFMFNDDANGVHDRYNFQHAKFTLIDNALLMTGSENLNISSMPFDDKSDGTWGNRGVYIITDAPGLVAHALDIFQRDLDPANHADVRRWNAATDSPPATFVPSYASGGTAYPVQAASPLTLNGAFSFEVVQSPDNSLRTTDSLIGMVARAGAGGVVLVEQLYEHTFWGPTTSDPATDPNPRLEAYIDAARRGAMVRILLDSFYEDPTYVRNNSNTCSYVNNIAAAEGLDLECLVGNPTGTGIHNKMVLVWDGTQGWTHTGSINGSENSSKNNRELAIQVQSTDGYNYLAQIFDYDWTFTGGDSIFPPQPSGPQYVLISEVFYDTPGTDSSEEWVELYNPTSATIDLSGYKLGDEETQGGGEGMYAFPSGAQIGPGQRLVVALKASGYYALYGQYPDYEIVETVAAVPNLSKYSAWASGSMALSNSGDEVLLLDASDQLVDAVVYEGGSLAGVVAHPGVATGHSLERSPADQDTDDCSVDFQDTNPPTPGN